MFLIPIFFAKNTPAVFLHVEAELAGFGLACAEANAKVAVEKLNSAHRGEFFTNSDELFVFLIRRYE